MAIVEQMSIEYNRLDYRKWRFTSYMKKDKTFKKMYKRLLNDKKGEPKKILIGYGMGICNGVGIKGACVPCKGFFNYLKEQDSTQCRCIGVNEACTSQMCSKCTCQTGSVYTHRIVDVSDTVQEIKRVAIYGIRRCNNNVCRIIWDRDVNASRNIHKILNTEYRGEERPKYLCRKIKPKLKGDANHPQGTGITASGPAKSCTFKAHRRASIGCMLQHAPSITFGINIP